jgi:hypothetical protein
VNFRPSSAIRFPTNIEGTGSELQTRRALIRDLPLAVFQAGLAATVACVRQQPKSLSAAGLIEIGLGPG